MNRFIAISLISVFLAIIYSSLSAKEIYDVTAKTIGNTKFHTVNFQVSNGKLFIKQGKTQCLEVKMDENQLSLLHTDIQDGILKIYLSGYESGAGSKFYLTVEDLKGVYLTGSSSDITAEEKITVDELEIKHNLSPGKINLIVDANKINTELGSSGDITLAGTVKNHDISLLGSGDIKSFDLLCESCKVNILGSGTVEVNVTEKLDVKIMGTGEVLYKGKPEVEKQVLGNGTCKEFKE
ncbi:MAG: head GIN domain-containing protein [Candidatus Eremiobacterota bacterium]